MKRLFLCFAAATIPASCNPLYEVGNALSLLTTNLGSGHIDFRDLVFPCF